MGTKRSFVIARHESQFRKSILSIDAKNFAFCHCELSEAISLIEKADALQRQIASLSIRAGVSGRIAELDPLVKAGRILSREDEVGVIIAGETAVIRGYIDQQDLWRIIPGNTAIFIPDDMAARSLPASLRSAALSARGPADRCNHG